LKIGLGHKEKAVAWLEKAYEDHDDDTLLNIKTDPVFDPLPLTPTIPGSSTPHELSAVNAAPETHATLLIR